MIKIYILLKPQDITVKSRALALEHLITKTTTYNTNVVESMLKQHKQWHALALIYSNQKQYERALDLWEKLGKKELSDEEGFDGVAPTVRLLSSLEDSVNNQNLVWKYSAWILKANRLKGMEVSFF
jgi:hypothetical protein